MRIVSLLPSATEIVCALGLQEYLVGRSHECDFPAGVETLPVCTAPKFNPHGSSADIDQSVLALVRNGLSVYHVNEILLNHLQPDFILTQSQCEVCAVNLKNVEQAVCRMIGSQPKIINLEPVGYADIFTDIQRTGEMLGVTEAARQVVNQMRERMTAVHAQTRSIAQKKTVVCIEWLKPLMNAGNWIPTVVEKAGGINVLSLANDHSHYINWEDVFAEDPDALLIMPCGFDIARSRQEMHLLTNLPGWQTIRAVQNKDVFITDGNQYFNRPGPRIADSVEIVAEMLYPHLFTAQYHGTGWINLAETYATPGNF